MARAVNMKPRGGMRGKPKQPAKKGTLKRLLQMLFKENKKLIFVVFACLTISAITGVSSSIFLNHLLTQIDLGLAYGLDYVIKSLIVLSAV